MSLVLAHRRAQRPKVLAGRLVLLVALVLAVPTTPVPTALLLDLDASRLALSVTG